MSYVLAIGFVSIFILFHSSFKSESLETPKVSKAVQPNASTENDKVISSGLNRMADNYNKSSNSSSEGTIRNFNPAEYVAMTNESKNSSSEGSSDAIGESFGRIYSVDASQTGSSGADTAFAQGPDTSGSGGGSAGSGGTASNEVNDVNISQPQLSTDVAAEQSIRLQHILSFFKTPTKQFMPLGLYAMVDDIRNVERLKALGQRGVILFHKYDSQQTIVDALGDLRSAREAGVAILQNLPAEYLTEPKVVRVKIRGKEFWQPYIATLVKNDQILAWYLPEEVKLEDLDKLEQLGNIIRATDTKHRPLITYIENAPPEYLKQVSGIVDAVVFGAYPSEFGDRPRIEIKRRIDWAYKSGVPVVIAALEALKGKFNWTRHKDVRFDAYLSLISGAKGIMWYGYYQARPRPELLEAVLEVATELNGPESLGEVLLSGKEPEALRCKNIEGRMYFHEEYNYATGKRPKPLKWLTSIQWTAREYKDYLYIFAVNTAQKVGATDDGGRELIVKVRFGPITTASLGVEVISEKRMISMSGNYFVDSFEPLGTHIYKIKLR